MQGKHRNGPAMFTMGQPFIFFKKIKKTVLTAGFAVLTIPSLYKNSLRILEIGRPWVSTTHASVEIKTEMLC